MPNPSVFGDPTALTARAKREMSQAELAAKTRLPPAVISHFETGVRQFPSADTLVKLTDALLVSSDYLSGTHAGHESTRRRRWKCSGARIGMDEASDHEIATLQGRR